MAYDVFLSHSSEDKPFVRAMADWLDKHGVTFLLDKMDLQPGDRLTEKFGQAMAVGRRSSASVQTAKDPGRVMKWKTLFNKAIKVSREKDESRIIPVLLPNSDTS